MRYCLYTHVYSRDMVHVYMCQLFARYELQRGTSVASSQSRTESEELVSGLSVEEAGRQAEFRHQHLSAKQRR